MNYLGVDPGLTGAIILLSPTREIILKAIMPSRDKDLIPAEFIDLLTEAKNFGPLHCYLERIISYGMNPSSAFTFGRCFGTTETLIAQMQIPCTYVEAKKWTRLMHEGIDARFKPKEKSLIAFERLFPGVDLRANNKCKKPHDGLIDALLIAEFARRQG